MPHPTYKDDINFLINQINEIKDKDFAEYTILLSNNEIFPSAGYRSQWKDEVVDYLTKIIDYYNYFLKVSNNEDYYYYKFLDAFKKIHSSLSNLFNIIVDQNATEDLNNAFSEVFNAFRFFEKLKTTPFQFSPSLTRDDFILIYNEVKSIRHLFDPENEVLGIYDSCNEEEKNEVCSNLINIRNIARKEKHTLDDGIELKKSLDYIFDRNTINEAKELVSEVKEISETFKSNVTKETNKEILATFSTTTEKLEEEIKKLNNWIIFLFCSIMLILSTKVFLILFMEDKFKDIYNFLLFLTLILSCSALLTYFIKEKNYLRKLYDFYLMKGLELNALPGYMNELTPEQRRTLIVQLAPMYFLGDRDVKNPTTSTESNNIQTISGLVTELGKMIKELKP
jgi:hypothetical protein